MKNKIFEIKKTSWAILALIPIFFFLIISSCNTEAPKTDVEKGQDLYMAYCDFCHGKNGDGAMANMLDVPPPDLSQISTRRNGQFPDEEIYKIIDGQQALEAGHGARDMPIWSEVLKNSEGIDPVMVPKKIYELIEYLKSIQQ